MRYRYRVIPAFVVLLSACSTGLPTNNITLGMSKDQVVQNLGKPHGIISAEKLDSHTREVVEYRRDGIWWGDLDETYWFYFADDKLEKWGRPGDHLRHLE